MKILRIDKARKEIGRESLYLLSLNDVNIRIRGGVNLKDLIRIRKNSVLDLYAAEHSGHYNILQSQIDKYKKIGDYEKYTKHTGVILSDGSDEQNASHCHNNNIIISISMLENIESIFAHELWHIISRNMTDKKRADVYKSFDIYPCTVRLVQIADTQKSKYIYADKLNFLQNPDNITSINPKKRSIGTYSFEIFPGYRIVVLPMITDTMFGSVFVGKIQAPKKRLVELTGDEKKNIVKLLRQKYKTNYLIGADEVVAEIFSKIYS
jgi:hypothetical protein